MKRLMSVIALSFSVGALGQSLEAEIRDFNFSYHAPVGQGTAQYFYRNQKSSDGVAVEVLKKSDVFAVTVSGAEDHQFELKDAPEVIQNAGVMTINGMSLNFRNSLSFQLADAEFLSSKDELKLSGVQLDCQRDHSQVEIKDQVLMGCLQSMQLNAGEFGSGLAKQELMQALVQALNPERRRGDPLEIESLNFTSNGGNFNLSAEVDAQISGKVRGKGVMSYNPETELLTIRLNEVKFSFLNITSKVFSELEKQNNPKLKVQRPYIYLSLK